MLLSGPPDGRDQGIGDAGHNQRGRQAAAIGVTAVAAAGCHASVTAGSTHAALPAAGAVKLAANQESHASMGGPLRWAPTGPRNHRSGQSGRSEDDGMTDPQASRAGRG